jgi:hypothetical protein
MLAVVRGCGVPLTNSELLLGPSEYVVPSTTVTSLAVNIAIEVPIMSGTAPATLVVVAVECAVLTLVVVVILPGMIQVDGSEYAIPSTVVWTWGKIVTGVKPGGIEKNPDRAIVLGAALVTTVLPHAEAVRVVTTVPEAAPGVVPHMFR